jgi:vesicle coat complex subunit
MRVRAGFVFLVCLLAGVGCGKKKSTGEMIDDLKAPQEEKRIVAVRTLSQRQGEADQVVPALIQALKDKHADVRWNAAIGLGSFGEQAREAIPALQEARNDRDTRVREAARIALSRIDPNLAPSADSSRPS